MPARNDAQRFGWVSRGLHWLMAIGLLGNLGFGAYLVRIEPSFSTLWMYGAHKSAGLSLLTLVVARIVWHRISPPPAPLTNGVPGWQHAAARVSHAGLYLLLISVPLSGWAAASATGIPTLLFNTWEVPAIAPVSEQWDRIGFAVHAVLTKALLALVVLHSLSALYHALVLRNRTLARMIRGK